MTGAYKNHFKVVPKDWHDWDVSSAPAIIKTAGGKKVLSVAPKDGHLYGFDLDTNALLYRQPVTRMENEDAPFVVGKTRPLLSGSVGGAEWNGPAYDPQSNLVFIGEVEWCTTVTLMPTEKMAPSRPANHGPAKHGSTRSTRGVSRTRLSTGQVGPTPLTPTLALGDGEQRRIIPFKAA